MVNIFSVLVLVLFLSPVLLLIRRGHKSSQRLPPGSLGIPVVGQSLSLLRAMRANTAEAWLQHRINKYGPISKLSLFGNPTVFISGQAANKFVFSSDGKLGQQQTKANKRILGERNLLELSGEDHKRVRNALVSFLKPESVRQYVGKTDEEIRGKEKIMSVRNIFVQALLFFFLFLNEFHATQIFTQSLTCLHYRYCP